MAYTTNTTEQSYEKYGTRRRFLAVGTAAAVFASLREAVARERSAMELARAIAEHRQAFDELESVHGDDASNNRRCEAEAEAKWRVAVAPVSGPDELLAKLRHLLKCELAVYGEPSHLDEFGSVALAVDAYFNASAYP